VTANNGGLHLAVSIDFTGPGLLVVIKSNPEQRTAVELEITTFKSMQLKITQPDTLEHTIPPVIPFIHHIIPKERG
jgi:hypothetical protein